MKEEKDLGPIAQPLKDMLSSFCLLMLVRLVFILDFDYIRFFLLLFVNEVQEKFLGI
jgi:hypothetical protein